MTPTQIEQAARERYNAVAETFWSQTEILSLLYGACLELSTETKCIERTYSTTTVSGTKEYAYPTSTIAIKYVTYNGIPIDPIDLDEGNAITLNTTTAITTGAPQGYSIWNFTISLWPTPDDAQTLKLYTFQEAQAITLSSVLEIPSVHHMRILNYINAFMAIKDSNLTLGKWYLDQWEKDKIYIKAWVAKGKRSHRFSYVKDEETLGRTYRG